jgi:toxin secretion/phage lysis holin
MEKFFIYFLHLYHQLESFLYVKLTFGAIVTFVAFFFDPTMTLALRAIFVLVLIDFVLGIAAARYVSDPIRSAKLWHTAIKMCVYFAIIAASRVTEHCLTPMIPTVLDETITGFLAATELLSILENTGRMGFAVPQKIFDILGNFVVSKTADRRTFLDRRHNKKK